jgi:hypothetical protein
VRENFRVNGDDPGDPALDIRRGDQPGARRAPRRAPRHPAHLPRELPQHLVRVGELPGRGDGADVLDRRRRLLAGPRPACCERSLPSAIPLPCLRHRLHRPPAPPRGMDGATPGPSGDGWRGPAASPPTRARR